jgi:hypothetical protein
VKHRDVRNIDFQSVVPSKCATIESRAADNMLPERTGQGPMFQTLQRGMVGDWT